MSLRILTNNTPPNHERHLCEECMHRESIRGSHMNEDRCAYRDHAIRPFLIVGKIFTCSNFQQSNEYVRNVKAAYEATWIEGEMFLLSPQEAKAWEHHNDIPERVQEELKAKGWSGERNPAPRVRRRRNRREGDRELEASTE